jgi:DNA polymerase theta
MERSPETLSPTPPLQVEALNRPGVLQGTSLVYSASTSAGKSLVSEVLMLRRVLTTGKPAMLVLPFVALCAEKAAQLERLLAPMNRTVKSFYGGNNDRQMFTPDTGTCRGAWVACMAAA